MNRGYRYSNYEKDSKRSIEAYKVIAPIIEKKFKCKLDNIEGSKLDLENGVDYIIHKDNKEQYIAARIQYNINWGTFTIRLHRDSNTETEYNKIKRLIETKDIHPTYHLQVYLTDNNELIAGAIVNTEGLFKYIELHYEELLNEKNRTYNSEFIAIKWVDLKRYNSNIIKIL